MARALLVFVLLIVLPVPALAAPTALPWRAGDRIALPGGGAAVVEGVERRLEFVRLHLRLEADPEGLVSTRVEIRYHDGPPEEFATAHYLVQPAPGVPAHLPAIRAILAALTRWDLPGRPPFVAASSSRTPPPPAAHGGLGGAPEASWTTPAEHGWGRHAGWLILNLLAVVLFVMVVGAAVPAAEADTRRLIALGRRLGLYAVVGGLLVWVYGTLPPTSMQEGGTGARIEQLYGHGIHHGPNFTAVMHALTGGHGYGLAELAARNAGLRALASVLFWAFALRRLGPRLGTLLAAVFALNHTALHAASSELPSALVVLYAVALVLALDTARTAAGPGAARDRALALGLAILLTALLWATRREAAVVGVAALLALGLERLNPRARLPPLAVPALVLAVVLLVLPAIGEIGVARCSAQAGPGGSSAPGVAPLLPAPGHWCYLARALTLDEIGRSLVWLPGFMLGTALPVAVGLLVLAALVRLLFRPLAGHGLAAASLLLYRVYFIAGHGLTLAHYELFRYATIFQPLWLLVAVQTLAGIRAHPRWLGLPDSSRRVAGVAFFGLCALFPAMSSDYLPRWPQPLATNQQLESATLLRVSREHPRCAFVAAVAAGPANSPRPELALFGGPDSGVSPARYPLRELDHALADARNAPCHLVYRGVDCALLEGACALLAARAPALEMRTWRSRPYLASHFAHPPAGVRLRVGLYDLDSRGPR